MISINYKKTVVNSTDPQNQVYYIECAGLPTDTKPTQNIAIGSVFRDVANFKKYRFNGTSWVEEN